MGRGAWKADGAALALQLSVQTEFSLAELLDEGVPIAPDEAVAVVLRLAPHAAQLAFASPPSLDDIYLTPGGVRVGAVARDAAFDTAPSPVRWLANTLHALLAYSEGVDAAMPLGLQFLVARACGHRFGERRQPIDPGVFRPFGSVGEFVKAAERFLPPDPAGAIRAVHARAAQIQHQ